MAGILEEGQDFAGRFRVQRLLATGGMGAVYVAQQTATEQIVALKVLLPHMLGSARAAEQFELEARVAARVRSENIVQILDAGRDASTGYPFLAMELLEGLSLEDLVLKRGPLPANEVAEYLRQVAAGLDKAHGYVDREGKKKPIVHRDLKPENLFLTHRESGEPVVKILDFGIAKVLSHTSAASQEIKGTPLFMAYEQALGEKVTPMTDVWALGLIAFYLLTGKNYWKSASSDDSTIASMLTEILSLPMDPASLRGSFLGSTVALPSGFDEWLMRCLDRDPAKRFPSAGECAVSLSRALLGKEPTKAGSLATSNAVPLGLSSSGSAGSTTGPSAHASTASQLSLSSTQAAVLAPRGRTPLLALGGAVAVFALFASVYLSRNSTVGEGGTGAADALPAPARLDAEPPAPVVPAVVAPAARARGAPAPSVTPAPGVAPTVSPILLPAPATSAEGAGASPRPTRRAAITPKAPAAPNAAGAPSPRMAGTKPAKPVSDVYGDR